MGQYISRAKEFIINHIDGLLRQWSQKRIMCSSRKDNVISQPILNTEGRLRQSPIPHITATKQEKEPSNNSVSGSCSRSLRKTLEEDKKLIDVGLPRKPNDVQRSSIKKTKAKWIKHYCSSHKILLVGEGDFSFATCLASAFGTASNMVATSLDSIGFLARNYTNAISNLQELKNKGCNVIHEFDATEMATYQFLHGIKFDRIIYNFPLAGYFRDETREKQLMHNQNLVRLFMVNAKRLLEEDGELHITHKSHGFFLEWNLEKLGRKNGLWFLGEVPFNLSDYSGYNTKYGFGGDNNFDCEPSKTYLFGLKDRVLGNYG